MTRLNSTAIDIYFHMSNHYKKLRSVKSVVDTSAPSGYYQMLQSGRQSRPPSRADKCRQSSKSASSINSDRIYYDTASKNICNSVRHDSFNIPTPTTRSQSLPLHRPLTRRKPSDMPNAHPCSTRARSGGPSRKANSMTKTRSARSHRPMKCAPVPVYFNMRVNQENSSRTSNHHDTNECITTPVPIPRGSKTKKPDTSFKKSISDHDYLQFSLRITEDIIRNDLYTNKEMRRVFNSHLEANRERLEMTRMMEQIENLCKELNIPLDESADDDDEQLIKSQIKLSQQNMKSTLACICGPAQKTDLALKQCECGKTRQLPFECVQHNMKTFNIVPNILSNNTEGSNNERFHEYHFLEVSECEVELMNPKIHLVNGNNVVSGEETQNSGESIKSPSLTCVSEKTEPTTSQETISTPQLDNLDEVEMEKPHDRCSDVTSNITFETAEINPDMQEIRYSLFTEVASSILIRNDILLNEKAIYSPTSPIPISYLAVAPTQTTPTKQAILETRSEPIKASTPIPTPRNFTRNQMKNFDFVTNQPQDRKVGVEGNPELQLIQVTKVSNIKVLGPNNHEEEFVLLPGFIYVPKSCIISAQPITLLNKDLQTFSKSVETNTEPFNMGNLKSQNSSNKIVKPEEFESSCLNTPAPPKTYSDLHAEGLNNLHFPSFDSSISKPPKMEVSQRLPNCTSELSENVVLSFNQPRKSLQYKNLELINTDSASVFIHSSTPTHSFTQNSLLAQFNDYDLTPQRDLNSKDSKLTIGTEPSSDILLVNKENLLLGDKYELKNISDKPSDTMDFYENCLPYAISQFYPNVSTQTRSSDFLLKASSTTINKNGSFASSRKTGGNSSHHSESNSVEINLKDVSTPQRSYDTEIIRENDDGGLKSVIATSELQIELDIKSEESSTKMEDNETKDTNKKDREYSNNSMESSDSELIDEYGDEDKNGENEPEEVNKGAEVEILQHLDKSHSLISNASILLAIEKAKNDMEKLRRTEITPEKYVETKSPPHISNLKPALSDDSPRTTSSSVINRANGEESTSSKMSGVKNIPELKKEYGGDTTETKCCGLKKKKRKQTDLTGIDASIVRMPDINMIPDDDQLFPMDDRRATFNKDYGTDRKSLRFHYSQMDEYADRRGNTGSIPSSLSTIRNKTSPSLTSEQILPITRRPIVTYRNSEEQQQIDKEKEDKKATTTVPVNENPRVLNNSVVDILTPPQRQLSTDSFMMAAGSSKKSLRPYLERTK